MDELAIFGGNPVRDTYLPYGRQYIDQKDINSVTKTLKSDYLTTGPSVTKFEQKIADYTGATYAVAFNSGTSALHGATFAAGLHKGHEVITTSLSFVATANCLLYQYALPVFVDINKSNLNLSYKKVKSYIRNNYIFKKSQLINKKSGRVLKGIIPVHFAGHPAKMDKFYKMAKKFNLTIIEDGAHALGSSFYSEGKWNKTGSCTFSDMTVFSFHPVKHITTAEGGIVTTNSRKLYNILIQFRSHGITRNPDRLSKNPGPWYYEMQFLGYNYRMPDLNAALGISQIQKSNIFIQKRSAIAAKYIQELSDVPQIILPKEKKWARSSWHIFVIRLKLNTLNANRKQIFKALRAENIGVNVHYIPIYKQPFYKKSRLYLADALTNTEQIYKEIITLPIYPSMNEKDINDVIEAVKKVVLYFELKDE